ncbi:MAG: UDP-N-acetylglucosamine diphosphorylase [Verrucomicrobiae bacterium]|nr:UDP-N-acetylglucosamine diphosphorylase [Verrucomicrobiae bacterium]MCP5539188.1 UDP-N-acetylglucosamine diphosphorylase [Akkermansiaceae bacterium]MCP5549839.1 UDP-N-acetylglucosamine diphosphorylase [Akkermansiaceae bacterium]
MFSPRDYLDLERTAHGALFGGDDEPVWSAIGRIGDYLDGLLDRHAGERLLGEVHERAVVGELVYVGAGAVIEANAVVRGPAWIGEGTVVRSGAYVRERVVTGGRCVLGNSCEFKNCLLFDECEVPHFNYVGDSILGYRAHLGAGVICSNVRLDRRHVTVATAAGEMLDTGLRKFGAVVGDRTEIGCNSVLSPGSLLGRDGILYPGTHWRGVLAAGRIVKNRQNLVVVERPDGGDRD